MYSLGFFSLRQKQFAYLDPRPVEQQLLYTAVLTTDKPLLIILR